MHTFQGLTHGPPDQLARRIAVGHQSFELSTVGGAKMKADVGASHAPNIANQTKLEILCHVANTSCCRMLRHS